MRTERSALAVRTAMLAAAAAATVLLQCGEDQTKPAPPNEPPLARITAGGASSEPEGIDYRVDFHWTGSDPDGAVAGFEWAIDDTVTEAAWRWTRRHGEQFAFTAMTPMPWADSLLADWHSFYLRAVDDDSARSAPDIRYFNARTVAPVTRITLPVLPGDGTPTLRLPDRIEWVGEDADGPGGKPVAYEYKLVRLPPGSFPSQPETYLFYLRTGDNELAELPAPAKKNWIRVSESVRAVDLDSLVINQPYVFGVRAIDAAGAVEPRMEVARNFFAFVSVLHESFVRISVEIDVEGLGVTRVTFPDIGDSWRMSVPAGVRIHLSWSGETPDGVPLEWSYAFDPPGGPSSDWSDRTRLEDPIIFGADEAGTRHWFFLRARRVGEDLRSDGHAIVRFDVLGGPEFSRFALVVDDARFQVATTDAAHDAFINNVFLRRLRDYGEVEQRAIFEGASEGGQPRVIPLEEMAQYRHIFWSCEPRNTRSGIAYDLGGGQNNNNRNLAAYLALGGRLFVFGGRSGGMERSDYGYPVSPPSGPHDPKRDMLYYRFLHLRDWIVSSACAGHAVCDSCYGYVSGLIGARALNPAFPDLTLDESKWDPWTIREYGGGRYCGGLGSWEGSMHLGEGEPEQVPGLDSLYAAVTWDRALAPGCSVPSPVSGAVCAVRYESTPQDTLEHRAHGRTIGFLFQPYWFLPDQIQSAGTAAIEWLVRGK